MRLFGKVDSSIDRFDRAEWLTAPFDLAFQTPSVFTPDESDEEMSELFQQTASRLKCVGVAMEIDLSTAVSLTKPAGYEWDQIAEIWINAQTEDIRYWLDGSTPTGSAGALLKANTTGKFNVRGDQIKLIQGASGAKAAVQFFAPAAE